MSKSGEAQNRKSEVGMSKKHAKVGTVHDIERVGSKHPSNHSFRMPKDHEVTDHSKVRGLG
jgi:hypothetical protein